MSTTLPEHTSKMSWEIALLRKRLAAQQAILLALFAIVIAVLCAGAASRDGHFDRVFAKSVIIRNARGEPAAQLYATDDAGSLLIRDSSGREAIHIISGSERNDVLINDRNNGNIAVAIQGMKDHGRMSVLRTFPNVEAARASLSQVPKSYLSGEKKEQVIVPVFRLPE